MQALALVAALCWAAPPRAEPGSLAPAGPQPTPVVAEAAAGATAGAGATPPAGASGEQSGGVSEQTLSTLGALLLGVVGLLWVRRRTAET